MTTMEATERGIKFDVLAYDYHGDVDPEQERLAIKALLAEVGDNREMLTMVPLANGLPAAWKEEFRNDSRIRILRAFNTGPNGPSETWMKFMNRIDCACIDKEYVEAA